MVKLFWFVINLFKHNFTIESNSGGLPNNSMSFRSICVIVEYEGFVGRDIKDVGGVRYKCGKDSIKLVQEKCELNNIPVLKIITTDNKFLASKNVDMKQNFYIRNRGTDIAALEDVIEQISGYQRVIFCNSSAPFEQLTKYLDDFFLEIGNSDNLPRLIGLNGNSRPSPALPFFHAKFPHIISNFIYADVSDIKNVLEIGKKSFLYKFVGGYGNKYFAIRYFELLLSAYVIKKGGKLCCIHEKVSYYPSGKWFDEDSRIKEYFNY